MLGQPLSPGLRVALGFMVVSVLLLPILVYLWILHNLRVARRWRARRGERQDPHEDFHEDFLGRSLAGTDLHTLQGARELVIELQGEHKRYRAADSDAADGRPGPGAEEAT